MSGGSERGGQLKLRVVVGEDDVLLREGIVRILTGLGHQVVAQAGDAETLLSKSLAYRPAVVITDVRMPPRHEDDGLRAAIEIRRRRPEVGVLILSHYCEPDAAAELIGEHPAGVGYLLKERVGDLDSFADALVRVARGGSALDAEVVGGLVRRRAVEHEGVDGLTPRELAVLSAMAEGRSNLGIAHSLNISQASVEKHVTAILRKLDIPAATDEHRRVHAVLAYLRSGR